MATSEEGHPERVIRTGAGGTKMEATEAVFSLILVLGVNLVSEGIRH